MPTASKESAWGGTGFRAFPCSWGEKSTLKADEPNGSRERVQKGIRGPPKGPIKALKVYLGYLKYQRLKAKSFSLHLWYNFSERTVEIAKLWRRQRKKHWVENCYQRILGLSTKEENVIILMWIYCLVVNVRFCVCACVSFNFIKDNLTIISI